MSCRSCTSNLGTPGDYARRAKAMAAQGHPGARQAAIQAAVAYRVASAAQQGDMRLAAKGLKALRALNGLGSARDPARAAARIRELSQRTVTQATGTIRTIQNIAGGIAGLVGAIGMLAISDANTRRDFDLVMQWIRAFISGTIPASLRTDAEAMRVVTIICAGWGVLGPLVEAGLAFWASSQYALAAVPGADQASRRNEGVAIETFSRVFVGFVNQMCADPMIQAALAPPPAALPPVEDVVAPTAVAYARRNWQTAMANRAMNEALPLSSPAQVAFDCSTSAALRAANDALEALGGSTTVRIAGRTYTGPSRTYYISRRPASHCPVPTGYTGAPEAGGGGGGGGGAGGGGGLMMAAGAAAVAALFFLR